jgi:hypothetical protein
MGATGWERAGGISFGLWLYREASDIQFGVKISLQQMEFYGSRTYPDR